MIKKNSNNNMQPSKRTFQNTMGKWVEKTTRTEILVCYCNKKYIKTRTGQKSCLPCMYIEKTGSSSRNQF